MEGELSTMLKNKNNVQEKGQRYKIGGANTSGKRTDFPKLPSLDYFFLSSCEKMIVGIFQVDSAAFWEKGWWAY